MNSGPHRQIREEAFESNRQIPKHRLAIYTFGNVSAFDPNLGVFAINPSGVANQNLIPGSMVVVNLDGKVVDGNMRPSSETATHRLLYKAFEGIRGVAHTHSAHAVAWAQAVRPIPICGTTHADLLVREIPCTQVMDDGKIQGEYEVETGKQDP